MTLLPPTNRKDLRLRASGRGLITDAAGRVLLLRGSDPHRPGQSDFWWTPGGGIDDNETPEQATKRELWEELGLLDANLSQPILIRSCVFPLAGVWYEGIETFFWVEAPPGFEPVAQDWEEIEAQVIQEMRWLSLDEIRALSVPVYPECLADLAQHILAEGPPLTPWVEHDERNG